MHQTITVDGWLGRLNAGLPRRQLEAVMLAAQDKTAKEIARDMGISPDGVRQRLDEARFKLGMQRTTRGLCLEAIRRGIIAPLVLALMVAGGHGQQAQTLRRPSTPRSYAQARISRRVEDLTLHA